MVHFSKNVVRLLSGELLNGKLCSSLIYLLIRLYDTTLSCWHLGFFYYFKHSLFEHTCVFANFKNMTYSLNCIPYYYVHSGFTLFGFLLWWLLPWYTSKNTTDVFDWLTLITSLITDERFPTGKSNRLF